MQLWLRTKGSKHYLRIDLHVVSEADIVDDIASEVRPVERGQSTQAAINSNILSRQDILILGRHLIGDLHEDALLQGMFCLCSVLASARLHSIASLWERRMG